MKKLTEYINGIFVAIALLISTVSFAQIPITVSGVVTDENGESLPGASVVVENTQTGALTDASGKYSIRVQPGKVLVFSFIGYKPATEIVSKNKVINKTLEPDTKLLDEVVVVGYGTMKRSDLTGAVSSVSAKALENYKTASVFNALGGMVAGVNIVSADGAPGSGFDVKIRGVGTVNGDSSPLYIVDGFEVSNLDYLANNDIQSVEVLKDASACAIYGARAANGVVLVTTKSGRVGKPEITYNGSVSYRIMSKHLDVLTPYEFVDLQMEINPVRYEGHYYKAGNDKDGLPYSYQTHEDYLGVSGVDWQDESFRPTWSQNHEFSVRGGTKATKYLASFSHFDEDGIFTTNTYAKNTARVKFDQQVFKWLSFTASIDYTSTKNTGIGTSGNTLSNILMARPTGGLITSDHELRYCATDPAFDELHMDNTYYNPIVNAENTHSETVTDRLNAHGTVRAYINKYLDFRTSGSYSLMNSRQDRFYQDGTSSADRGSGPYGNSKDTRYLKWSVTNQLTYKQTFRKHHKVNATLGHETSYVLTKTLEGEAKDFPLDDLKNDNLGLGAVPSYVRSSKTDSRRLSFFARAFYSYADKYMLTATVRADASSVFSENHKWGCFPSFSAAWNMSNEKWLKDVSWLSNLKLRAGWGMVGNDRITNYLSLDIYNSIKYGLGASQVTTLYPSHLANKNLKWEASATTNVGLDLGFFNDRLNVTLDGFIKDSKDLLISQDLTYASGFKSQMQNIGKIRNKGLELTINSVNINRRNFSWRTDFNISFIRNTLMALESGKDYMLSNSGLGGSFTQYDYISEVGKPLGSMYGYVFDGVYQTSDFEIWADGTMHLKPGITDMMDHYGNNKLAPGYAKYKDIDGDGKITDKDRTAIGNGQPDFYGGITNNFYFYGFDLSFMFQFTYGNDVYNAQRMYANQTDLEMVNMMGEVRYRWRPDYASNTVPSAKGIKRGDVTSRFIEDGSYLRLKNLTLGYTFPNKVVRHLYLTKLRIYVTAENLFCLTKYSGSDPEVNMRSSTLMPSFDYGAYPRSRVFTFGVELNF